MIYQATLPDGSIATRNSDRYHYQFVVAVKFSADGSWFDYKWTEKMKGAKDGIADCKLHSGLDVEEFEIVTKVRRIK